MSIKKDQETTCIHSGEIEDKQFKGAVSPIFMATSYAYFDVDKLRYPRYFNTPNQESFKLIDVLDPKKFQTKLKLIKPSLSLAGVESTILQPAETSHKLIGAEKRKEQGISDGLLRLSVGIESAKNLILDLEQL